MFIDKALPSMMIGVSSGFLLILLISILKQLEKKLIYGIILSGIGFLYVGFVWTDFPALVINAIQAILFLFLAYYGIKRDTNILAVGYFLHGCWDITYNFLQKPGLIPPHYDVFCSSLDFTICIYLLVSSKRFSATRVTI